MLISNAYAQAAAGGDPMSTLTGLLPIILMFVVLWFMMIRPQMKRAKEQKAMVAALAKGDEVIAQSGIAGRLTKVGENYVTLEIAENIEVVMLKPSIATILPKGTLKTLP